MINTQLTTATPITSGTAIPVGTVVHRSTCDLSASGSAITISGTGHYLIIANASLAPTGATEITLTMNSNGTPVASASETPAVAGDTLNVSLIGSVFNKCACMDKVITIVPNAGGSVSELDIVVKKV